MRKAKKISNELLAKLYYKDGLSVGDIGRKKKISRGALYGRFARLGLKLRTRAEALELKRRHELERERKKLRGVLLRWSIGAEEVFENDAEVDKVMDRCDAIAQELKTLESPRKRDIVKCCV